MESLGWLMVAMTDANGNHGNKHIATIIEYLNNNVNETAETANFITSYGDDGNLFSRQKKNSNSKNRSNCYASFR